MTMTSTIKVIHNESENSWLQKVVVKIKATILEKMTNSTVMIDLQAFALSGVLSY